MSECNWKQDKCCFFIRELECCSSLGTSSGVWQPVFDNWLCYITIWGSTFSSLNYLLLFHLENGIIDRYLIRLA